VVDMMDLVSRDVDLKKISTTKGGEWAGPCPVCGGDDRFRVWPERERFWCRKCGISGDAIQYVRETKSLGFKEAKNFLGKGDFAEGKPRVVDANDYFQKPTPAWTDAAGKIMSICQRNFKHPKASGVVGYLNGRGITNELIEKYGLGYCPVSAESNGLWIPSGILIPWIVDGNVWAIRVRLADGDESGFKYKSVCWSKSSRRAGNVQGGVLLAFGLNQLDGRSLLVAVEGEFDAMVLKKYAGDLADIITLGSCSSNVKLPLMKYLMKYNRILVAYDNDESGQDGARKAAGMSMKMKNVKLPGKGDVTDYWRDNGNLREWVEKWL